MRCFIRCKVTARDLYLWILLSAQQLIQQMVGEYLTFFQNNPRSKFTSAQNQTLFLHQLYQPKGQWLSGNIRYSSVQALHLRWLDWIFEGGYLPSLSINWVGMSKDMGKRLTQLYYIKMKTPLRIFIYLCVSLYQESFWRNHLRDYVPAIIASIIAKFEQILWENDKHWKAASSHSSLIPLKTAYKKKEENCSGRSRVRRILLTCIQLLLLQFLHAIWYMPTNFALFRKLLDKFFYKLHNPEINCQ